MSGMSFIASGLDTAEVSPKFCPRALALIRLRTGFPALFLGMSFTKMTSDGMAIGPKVFRTKFLMSFCRFASPLNPGFRMAKTTMFFP